MAQLKSIQHGTSSQGMEVFVVDVEGSPPVFGRPWLELLKLEWKAIKKSKHIGQLAEISIKTIVFVAIAR